MILSEGLAPDPASPRRRDEITGGIVPLRELPVLVSAGARWILQCTLPGDRDHVKLKYPLDLGDIGDFRTVWRPDRRGP